MPTPANLAALAVAAVAAVTDTRRGVIPNWLTLPPLVLAPLAHAVDAGWGGALGSLLGALLCGVPPWLLFRRGAMGGGDVKLLAALGALVGPVTGLEAELLAFVVAGVAAMGRLAWRGLLLRALVTSLRLAVNPLLPRRLRRAADPALMTPVTLGLPILAGTTLALLGGLPLAR